MAAEGHAVRVQVYRKGTDQPDLHLECRSTDTILVLKARISGACGVETHLQRLFFSGGRMDQRPDNEQLGAVCADLAVAPGATLYVTMVEAGEEMQYEGVHSVDAAVARLRRGQPLHGGYNGVDVVFSFDTTGSMYGKLEEIRSRMIATIGGLMNAVPSVRFGVIVHGDYCDSYDSYTLRRFDLCSDAAAVCTFISSIGATDGGDEPECYELALREARSMGWRARAKKVLVMIGDSGPHPPSYTDQCIFWRDEAEALAACGVSAFAVHVGDSARLFWNEVAHITGGLMFDNASSLSFLVDMFRLFCSSSSALPAQQHDLRAMTETATCKVVTATCCEEKSLADRATTQPDWASEVDDVGLIQYWYDRRWNKWNPKPLGRRFVLPRSRVNDAAWRLVVDFLSRADPSLLLPVSRTCQALFKSALWRVEFSIEYITRPGECVYLQTSTMPRLDIRNRMLWSPGHIWRLTKRVLPGAVFTYHYEALDSHITHCESYQCRQWCRNPRDEYASPVFLTGNTVLIRDYFGFPPPFCNVEPISWPLLEYCDDPLDICFHGEPFPASESAALPISELKVTVIPEFDYAPLDRRDFLSVVHIQAPTVGATADCCGTNRTTRAGTDLIAVIDTSGSMAGSRITTVKQALRFVVGQLQPCDRLCLITFESSATRVTRLQSVYL
eukprot:TRINITY_DN875_c0_g1_i1.p1 TRINITY_DN875_c0_g1~~TRINITY_DN875_c0_g1_i1.p1  ORF type:complete len:688 (+),score=119.93 TRINITY_DN875_c0_g1_i1:50-2065(+)